MDKLALSSAFQKVPGQLHTSSDGRKVHVAVDSLHANHSFKYFGKDKGVTMYLFIDERHALFHSTVISASEREAAYVIDGLMQNEVIKSDIHSTDTHGYTESIFAATHLIDTAFAPRLKKVGKQTLSSFSSRGTHQRRGDVILPGHTVNQKLILSHWDDILRFMATIKLRHSSASQLSKSRFLCQQPGIPGRQFRRAGNCHCLQGADSECHRFVEHPISIAGIVEHEQH